MSYHVQVDNGIGGAFTDVSGSSSDDLTTSRIVSTGIVAGRYYRARYRARNIKGFSSFSPIGYIEASQVPDAPASPTVVVSGVNVVISWTLPYAQGNAIKQTEVYILNKSGSFVNDATSQSSTSVTIPLTSIISTYSLVQGDSIVAQVRVRNDNGWSAFSSSSSGSALVQVAPHKPSSAPVSVYSPLDTSDADYGKRLTISCSELTGDATGGSPILSYQIEYALSGSGSWTTLGGLSPSSLVTQYTVTGLTNGQLYDARCRAQNLHGWGDYSDVSTLLAAEVPVKISPPATSTHSGSQVVIAWTKPADGGSPITGYTVLFKTSSGALTQISS